MIRNFDSLVESSHSFNKERELVLEAVEEALSSIDPRSCVRAAVRKQGNLIKIGTKLYDLEKIQNIYLISFGKAAVKMGLALLEVVKVKKGLIVSNHDLSDTLPSEVEYIKAGHPLPDDESVRAGKKVIEILQSTSEKDLSFILISGGGSALLEVPYVALEDLQRLTKTLLMRGATINELNCIRKHLSAVKGGRLVKIAKGHVVSLIMSDVVGDPLDTIASGPTYYDSTTFRDAYDILKKYGILDEVPASVKETINKGLRGEIPDSLKVKEKVNASFENFLVATNFEACLSMKRYFEKKGVSVMYLGSSIQGEAKEVAKVIAGIASEVSTGRIALPKPCAVVFGGETTVTVKGSGKGGRNTEISLSIARYIQDKRAVFCSIGTDGIDGTGEAAGGIVDSTTIHRGEAVGLRAVEYLENNDSYTFLSKVGDAILTGPTGTNVADVAVMLVL